MFLGGLRVIKNLSRVFLFYVLIDKKRNGVKIKICLYKCCQMRSIINWLLISIRHIDHKVQRTRCSFVLQVEDYF